MDSAKVLPDKGIRGASVLLVTTDLAARERLTRELRAVGADVAERRHGPPPAVDIVLVDAATADRTSKQLDMICGDIRMRWSSVVRFEFLRAVPVGQPADLSELLESLHPAVAPDRLLRERVGKEDLVRVQLAPLGAIRILRAVTLSGRTMHLTFDGGETRGEVSVADGLVVCAFSETPHRSLQGGIALAPLLDLDAAQVTIVRRDHPAAVNIMEPVDQALELAAVERPSLMQPLPANDVGERLTSPAPRPGSSDRPTLGDAPEPSMRPSHPSDERPTAPPLVPRYSMGAPSKRFSQTISGGHSPVSRPAPSDDIPTRRGRTDSTAQFSRAMASSPRAAAPVEAPAGAASPRAASAPNGAFGAPSPDGAYGASSPNGVFGASIPPRRRRSSSSQGLPPVDPRLSLPPRSQVYSGPPPKLQIAPPADREAAVAKTLLARQPVVPRRVRAAPAAPEAAPEVATASPRGPELSDVDADAQVEAALDAVLPRVLDDAAGLDDEPPTKVRGGLPEQQPAAPVQVAAPEPSVLADLDLDDMEEVTHPPAAQALPPAPPATAAPPTVPVPEAAPPSVLAMQRTEKPAAVPASPSRAGLYGMLGVGAAVLAAAGVFLWLQSDAPRGVSVASTEPPRAAAPAAAPAAPPAPPAAPVAQAEPEAAEPAAEPAETLPEALDVAPEGPAAPEAEAKAEAAPAPELAAADAPAQAAPVEPVAAEPAPEPVAAEPAAAEPAAAEPEEAAPEEGERDKKGSDRVCAEASRVERSGDLDAAMALYEQGRELDPRSPRAYEGIARVSLKQDRPGDAVVAAERAVALRSRRARYRVLLGDALAADGQVDAAKEAWEKALELDPDEVNAKRRLYR